MLKALNIDEVEPIDQDDIIDVSVFDFTDDERWLYVSSNCPPEGNVQDIRYWLKNGTAEFESEESEALNGTRRSIDTRTFTRPKKRSNRMSFESIIEALTPPASNVWKRQSPLMAGTNTNVEKELNSANNKREFVPSMLKQIPPGFSLKSGAFGISGQESMEAFLNMSQSKGIDSFINLTEPEFADTLMNVSQPSELCSSLIDTTRESSFVQEDNIVDSQILTDSMMKTSMFGDVSDIKDFNDETFLTRNENDASFERIDAFDNDTFVANSMPCETKTNLNSTFNTFTRRSATSLPRNSLPIEVEKKTINSTFTSSPILTDDKIDFDKTLVNFVEINDAGSKLLSNGLNGTFLTQKQTLEPINVTLNLNSNLSDNCSDVEEEADFGNDLSSNVKERQSNATISRGTINTTFNGTTDLRRELLEQVQRNSEQNFDSTYNSERVEDEIADVATINHNNTYRKSSSKSNDKGRNKPSSLEAPAGYKNDKKYYTFTKKTNITDLKSKIESEPSLDSLDNTFTKPVLNYKNKLRAPRVLSKVPQLFQKSNPNLASNSLRNFDTQRYSNIPNTKYGRGCQPDIPRNIEGPLINKLLPLGRFKSGSEQRLLEVGGSIKEFNSKGACGSTESIESTQSAHSAPDLDDRLSVCSDSSHTSYNSQVMNSAQLHYMARLQEESLKQISTPKPNRRVMENNWVVSDKDLPSPILKSEFCDEIERGAPQVVNMSVKTSSPILSPVRSSIKANRLEDNHINDLPHCVVTAYQGQNNVAKKPEMLVRPMKHAGLENKTRLRAPTNWSAPNRTTAGVGSGIPRPASRIPAPRFARPSYGNNQSDWKKGCL